MPKLQKSVLPLNLDQYQVWIIDNETTSRYFRLSQFPDVLTGGKNAFLINGSPELVSSTDVLVEIKDANGGVIFCQPIRNYVEGLARLVSIEVYQDTPPGLATITILGQLRRDQRGNLPPNQFVNAYNVKWTKTINVAPFLPNKTPIRLYQTPELVVKEILSPYRYPIQGGGGQVLTTGSLSLISQKNTIFLSGSEFTRYMTGGKISGIANGVPFSSSIAKIVNKSHARLASPFTGSAQGTIPASSFALRFEGPTQFGVSLLTRSFADVALSKLTTFSGDVARAKIYVRGIDQNTNYQQIADVTLESTNLTVTQSLNTGEQNLEVGEFTSQEVVDLFWTAGTVQGPSYVSGGVALSYNKDVLLDSIHITSPSPFTSQFNAPNYFIQLTKPLQFYDQLEYTFAGNITCLNNIGETPAQLDVYLYGESFPSTSLDPYGVKLASYVVQSGSARRDIEDIALNFVAPRDGVSYLNFLVYSGDWYLRDISLRSARETGFNPDEIQVAVPVEGRRFERLQFKAELFDPNSNYFPLDIVSDIVYFDGGNAVFRGTDTRLDGILTVSPSGSGPTLTSKGFISVSGSYTPGYAIAIGAQTPEVKSKNTAFFAGTSSLGPEISIGDKLYGYYDYDLDQFILELDGILRIGGKDIRGTITTNPSYRLTEYITGSNADFYDVRGRNSVNAGPWNRQIGRMGNYTRGYQPFQSESILSLSPITTTANPFSFPSQSVRMYTSGAITLPPNHLFFNNALYTSCSFQLDQLNMSSSLYYTVDYKVDALLSWNGFPSDNATGQILLADNGVYVISSGSVLDVSLNDYPLFVPENRTGNTLYIKIRLSAELYPATP